MIIGDLVRVKISDAPYIKKDKWPKVGDVGVFLATETANDTHWCEILVNNSRHWLREHEITNVK